MNSKGTTAPDPGTRPQGAPSACSVFVFHQVALFARHWGRTDSGIFCSGATNGERLGFQVSRMARVWEILRTPAVRSDMSGPEQIRRPDSALPASSRVILSERPLGVRFLPRKSGTGTVLQSCCEACNQSAVLGLEQAVNETCLRS